MAIELIKSFLQQASASGARSTVLADLRWAAAIMFAALLAALKLDAPFWILVFIAILLGLNFIVYFAAYIFFGVRSPDSLRSERFTLSKLAIEHSIKGDNLVGFVDPEKDKRVLEIPASSPQKEDE